MVATTESKDTSTTEVVATKIVPLKGGDSTEPVVEENNTSNKDDREDMTDDEHEVEDDPYKESEWDEGGPSHCGYSEAVHNTLMSVGEGVQGVVGDPSEDTKKEMKLVSNWFQEASYAVRDFFRGDVSMKEDTSAVVASMQDDASSAMGLMMGSSKDAGDAPATDEQKSGAATTDQGQLHEA